MQETRIDYNIGNKFKKDFVNGVHPGWTVLKTLICITFIVQNLELAVTQGNCFYIAYGDEKFQVNSIDPR